MNKKVLYSMIIIGIIMVILISLGIYKTSVSKSIYIYSEEPSNARIEMTKSNFLTKLYDFLTSPAQKALYPLEKAVYNPGETVRVKFLMPKLCPAGESMAIDYRICYKDAKTGGVLKCSSNLLSSVPCGATYTGVFSFNAPLTPGDYIVFGEAKRPYETKWAIDYPEIRFSVLSAEVCPESGRVKNYYFENPEQYGAEHCYASKYIKFGSPPTCEKSYEYHYDVLCPEGYVVEGTNERRTFFTKSTLNAEYCKVCVKQTPPQPPTPPPQPPCFDNVTMTCKDGTIIVVEECTLDGLKPTGNKCATPPPTAVCNTTEDCIEKFNESYVCTENKVCEEKLSKPECQTDYDCIVKYNSKDYFCSTTKECIKVRKSWAERYWWVFAIIFGIIFVVLLILIFLPRKPKTVAS